MVKVDLITGFLGSGKTTFLLKYAKYFISKGIRIGILEYDYSAINIDMLLIGGLRGPKCEIEMLAAACDADCLKRRFSTKLIAMAMSGYERVIIEPSGVFDIDMFYDSLREYPLEDMYEIGNVFTVVSGDIEDNLNKEGDFLLASQAAAAGAVLLSKVQLCDKDILEKTKAHVYEAAEKINCRNFNPKFFEKDWNNLKDEDFEQLMKTGYRIPEYTKVIASEASEYGSVALLNVPEGLKSMEEKVRKLFGDEEYGMVQRVKGFIRDNGVNYQINATPEKFSAEQKNIGQNTIIVIGIKLNREAITELLA